MKRIILTFLVSIAVTASVASAADRIRITVVDSVTKQPMPGVWLTANIGNEIDELETNPAGVGEIFFTNPNARTVPLRIEKDGYVPLRISYNVAGGNVPEEMTIEMYKAVRIGGFVRDERANAIAGAMVSVRGVLREAKSGVPQFTAIDVRTDGSGKWECADIVPEGENISLRYVHRDFVADVMTIKSDDPLVQELRTMSAVKILPDGVSVAGKILDAQGKAIEAATITRSGDEVARDFPVATTDAAGGFQMDHCELGASTLTVRAKGFAAQSLKLPTELSESIADFRLVAAREMRVKVIDPDNKSIPGATVAIAPTRGNRTLAFRANTNDEGLFIWPEAPVDEEMRATITRAGFAPIRNKPIKAGDAVVTFPMTRE